MCRNMLLIIIFTNMVFLFALNANVFSSIYDMESQVETEAQIIKSLEEFISKETKYTKKIDIIKKYLNRIKEEHEIAVKDVEHYLGNPINAYTLIKRQTLDLKYVEGLIGNSTAYKRNNTVKYRTMEDLNAAIAFFLKIQMVYQLNATQLANGVLAGNYSQNRQPFVEYVTSMSTSDCYELGRSDYSDKDYNRNIAWLKQAFRKFNSNSYDVSGITKFDIIYQIVQMYTMMVDVDNASKWMTKLMTLVTHDPKYSDLENKHGDMLKRLLEFIGNADTPTDNAFPYFQVYEEKVSSACRGDAAPAVTTIHNNSRPLSCVYAHWPHPFLILARVKAEILNHEPSVTLFYDVISNSEIEALQLMAKPKAIQNDERLTRISRRVEEFTGLSMESTDSQYVIDYGLGGYYAKTNDISQVSKRINNNRMATVMFFLSNVDQGGATIFVNLRLTVFPVKGAALFWVNLLPTGEGDDRSFHAACPVMRGNKWVLTNWLYEAKQEWSLCTANGTSFTYGYGLR